MDRRRWILIPPAVWIASVMLIQILGGFTAPSSSDMPDQCPEESQNCARMMMAIDGTPEAVFSASMDWVEMQSQTKIEQEAGTTSHIVFRTPLMMFPDDVFIETGCTENGTWIQVHSESRLGYGDMGVNQNRIDALLEHLTTIDFVETSCLN